MDLQLQQESSDEYLFDEFDNEDDVFYSELRKQVLQLTAEDEEIYEDKKVASKQGIWSVQTRTKQAYYNWPGNREEDKDISPPKWILNLWRTGNGTGVFIPQIMSSRGRNNKQRKKGRKGRKQLKVEDETI